MSVTATIETGAVTVGRPASNFLRFDRASGGLFQPR